MNNAQKRLMIDGFAGLPFGEVAQCEAGDVGVLGVPSDVDRGPRSGAALAPDALRRMTGQLGTDLPVSGRDLGNLDLLGDWSGALKQLVTQMVDHDVVPVVLGGASDVASTVLGALPDLPVVAAMPLARQDIAARPANTIWVGLNGGQPAYVWDQISQRAMVWRTARQLDEGRADTVDMPERAVLWIDISVIDLGHAAGCVGLNPGGMKPETLVSVIGAMSCRWQAIVITGLAPARDTRGMSELAAIETLNAALRHG
ncbi:MULTISPECIES: arginase family protein [unclassified Ruegeria]|jgi:arginase family enzyme|uniref:arginase family protein n=1 Tax=unclassified Ruegeria TaxID=2625375 RepID=UPI00148A10B1|nr:MULTISPECIES: arginase family protein [unclassified Ruegeria]